MGGYRAFIEEDETNISFQVYYYHNPKRWNDNLIRINNPIRDINNWSSEIKYLNVLGDDISQEIKTLPSDKGGIYMFFIKGLNLSFVENYILYIGRCKYTNAQNIQKRAKEYFRDNRPMIKKMFRLWKDHLYYRYCPDVDNSKIDSDEIQLIRALLPPLNETIPDKLEPQETVPAFNNL